MLILSGSGSRPSGGGMGGMTMPVPGSKFGTVSGGQRNGERIDFVFLCCFDDNIHSYFETVELKVYFELTKVLIQNKLVSCPLLLIQFFYAAHRDVITIQSCWQNFIIITSLAECTLIKEFSLSTCTMQDKNTLELRIDHVHYCSVVLCIVHCL